MAMTEAESRCREAHSRMVERYIALRDHIVKSLGCSNCGEPAGYECRHDYGCIDADRNVPPDHTARGAPASGRRQSQVRELTTR